MKQRITSIAALGLWSLLGLSHANALTTAGISGNAVGQNAQYLGSPEPIFDQFGTSISHPFHFAFEGIYAGITGSESFDFDTGLELALGHNPINGAVYPSDGAAPTGEAYWAALIDINHGLSATLGVDESSKIGFAFRGFTLDLGAASDYFINTTTNVETRIYRNGEVGIFDLSDNSLVYTQTGLTNTVYTDWDGGDTGTTTYDTDSEAGDIDLSIEGWTSLVTTYYSDSASPVQVDGGTELGDYAIFLGTGEVTFVPEPNAIYSGVLALFSVCFMRRKRSI